MQRRRFDFEVLALLEEVADFAEDFGALLEDIEHALGGPHVDVAAAIARFLVGESVPLLRRGREGFGEQLDVVRPDRDFTLLREAEFAADRDLIARIEPLALRPPLGEQGPSSGLSAGGLFDPGPVRK